MSNPISDFRAGKTGETYHVNRTLLAAWEVRFNEQAETIADLQAKLNHAEDVGDSLANVTQKQKETITYLDKERANRDQTLQDIAEALGLEKGDVDGIGAAIEGLKQGLSVAGRALVIADRGLVHVQCEPPLHWGLDAGDEDAEEGWCTTWALAKYIEALAAGEAGK